MGVGEGRSDCRIRQGQSNRKDRLAVRQGGQNDSGAERWIPRKSHRQIGLLTQNNREEERSDTWQFSHHVTLTSTSVQWCLPARQI